jgi:serine/threonine-protein kinase
MPFRTRVWSAGKIVFLLGALAATYVVFAGIAMRVAFRAREVEVPKLTGQSVADASQGLANLGLGLRVDPNRRPDASVPEGSIARQDPPHGVQLRLQRNVRVWLSAGVSTTTIPVLVGQTERTARLRLEQDRIEISSVSEFRSPDYQTDAVVAQDPPPASRAPAVSLLLNRGEQATTYVMPDLIGMNGAAAAEVLRARGFRVTIVGSQPNAGVPPGTVLRQQPPGGFQLGAANPISIEVSR